jgi:ABC-type multidrug transport system ATPase subunit
VSPAAAVAAPASLAVRARGLSRRYGEREALLDLDLEVPRGVCHALLGPNGSGKTTFLRLVAGLLRPTGGELSVCGHALPREGRAVRARLGALFDAPLVPRHLTLSEALAYSADLRGGGIPAVRAEALLARIGLLWRRRDPLRTFSRGMAQRANLACALLGEPELLLLDEPFTGLDAEGSALVEAVIREAVAAGRTVLLVTHELRRAERLADAATWLDRGRAVRRAARGEWRAADQDEIA